MNLKGKVIQVLNAQSGIGKNGEWKKQDIIIETEGQYPKKVCVTLWSDKVGTLSVGMFADFSLDAESREYNGKWYTELKVWKFEAVGGSSAPSSPTPTSNPPTDGNDMPF